MNTMIHRRYRVISNTAGSLIVPAAAGGGIVFDNAAQSPDFDSHTGTVLTLAYTMGVVTNGYLFVGAFSRIDATEPTVTGTYNGVAMDVLGTVQMGGNGRITILGLKSPASG